MRRFKLLLYSILLIVLLCVIGIIAEVGLEHARSPRAASLLIHALMLALWLCAGAAMTAKRLHDCDKPGWHYWWLVLVPQMVVIAGTTKFAVRGVVDFSWSGGVLSVVGILLWLPGQVYLLLAAGTDGPNRFGYPP
jgi:uncharacterized membrane protein YhaH (DUF805 family)